MLAAIAWESIGKPKVWISNLSKATTAIGLVVTGIFAYSAINDRLKANRIQAKLDSYGVDEVSLACEVPPVETAEHPVHQPHHPHQPRNVIHADGAEASKMQEFDLQHAM